VSILRWDQNTLNTPYKQGLYGITNQGFILDFPISSQYRTQVATGGGLSTIAVRSGGVDTWRSWSALATV